jgi:hypothetical protein
MTLRRFSELWTQYATWLETGVNDRYVQLVLLSDGCLGVEVIFTDKIGGVLNILDFDSLEQLALYLEAESIEFNRNKGDKQ